MWGSPCRKTRNHRNHNEEWGWNIDFELSLFWKYMTILWIEHCFIIESIFEVICFYFDDRLQSTDLRNSLQSINDGHWAMFDRSKVHCFQRKPSKWWLKMKTRTRTLVKFFQRNEVLSTRICCQRIKIYDENCNHGFLGFMFSNSPEFTLEYLRLELR